MALLFDACGTNSVKLMMHYTKSCFLVCKLELMSVINPLCRHPLLDLTKVKSGITSSIPLPGCVDFGLSRSLSSLFFLSDACLPCPLHIIL